MTSSRTSFMLLLLLVAALSGSQARTEVLSNPIRKVVTMLQKMQSKVQEEGEKETALYEKYMCYCKNAGGDLAASIEKAGSSISEFETKIKAAQDKMTQLKDQLQNAQTERAAAKAAMSEATAVREKEEQAYAAEKQEGDKDLKAALKAIAAIDKGMVGAFLQTETAQTLQQVAMNKREMFEDDDDRRDLMSFLSGAQNSDYAPQSGQILGILKQMADEMAKNQAEATAAEEKAVKIYEALMAAKKKEVDALSKDIETKLQRIGSLGIAIMQMKNELGDTGESLLADKQFLANLDETCEKKKKEWDVIVKTRGEELAALADTIKILNDDDALELFKKTLPSSAASFMQIQVSASASKTRALSQLQSVLQPGGHRRNVGLELIALALKGKKVGFDKVISMIDKMVATLKAEQVADDEKKEYCAREFDLADDKKRGLERSVSDLETAIENATEEIAKLVEEIKVLIAGIKELDKKVGEATEQRKKENQDFKELKSSDTAAKELLAFAKDRLNKFYNPKLVKAALVQAPPPPPESFDAYTKKSEDNMGVIAMIDKLMMDLDKEMAEAETEEKNSQADYETCMRDSAVKRTTDAKLLSEKESTKAELESDLQSNTDDKAAASKELMSTMGFISQLHNQCDFLVKYYDVRKEARMSEIDALGKSKDVLSGADYSFLQMHSRNGSP
mmetsp:Transcript_65027/g.125558  ORF Transcript_65027/g.125558 Transcript_65027/m.125558 type:complete len:680 (-) Transcript_65027:36-2075(-)